MREREGGRERESLREREREREREGGRERERERERETERWGGVQVSVRACHIDCNIMHSVTGHRHKALYTE